MEKEGVQLNKKRQDLEAQLAKVRFKPSQGLFFFVYHGLRYSFLRLYGCWFVVQHKEVMEKEVSAWERKKKQEMAILRREVSGTFGSGS